MPVQELTIYQDAIIIWTRGKTYACESIMRADTLAGSGTDGRLLVGKDVQVGGQQSVK